jgi:hypothetical protein
MQLYFTRWVVEPVSTLLDAGIPLPGRGRGQGGVLWPGAGLGGGARRPPAAGGGLEGVLFYSSGRGVTPQQLPRRLPIRSFALEARLRTRVETSVRHGDPRQEVHLVEHLPHTERDA